MRLHRPQQTEQIVIVAENRQRRLVDDGNVGELEMRVQRVGRRDRRLDDGGEAHRSVEAAGLEGAPFGVATVGVCGRRTAPAP